MDRNSGVPAFRAAELLRRLAPGCPVDRSGGGKILEVYPAEALIQWGFKKRAAYGGDRINGDGVLPAVRQPIVCSIFRGAVSDRTPFGNLSGSAHLRPPIVDELALFKWRIRLSLPGQAGGGSSWIHYS